MTEIDGARTKDPRFGGASPARMFALRKSCVLNRLHDFERQAWSFIHNGNGRLREALRYMRFHPGEGPEGYQKWRDETEALAKAFLVHIEKRIARVEAMQWRSP